MIIIPGRALRANPESITTVFMFSAKRRYGGYGFRACAQEGASRNDEERDYRFPNFQSLTSITMSTNVRTLADSSRDVG